MNKLHKTGSAIEKAERLKKVRSLTGLSQADFCKNADVKEATYISWENARYGGLTQKGAEKIIDYLLTKTDVVCTHEWLFHGNGIGPSVIAATENQDPHATVDKEVELFKALNKNAIITHIGDDSMLPELPINTIVGGTSKIHSPDKCLNKNCIIKTSNGLTLVRKLSKSKKENYFTVTATNLGSEAEHLILQDIELIEIAPIIWIRLIDV